MRAKLLRIQFQNSVQSPLRTGQITAQLDRSRVIESYGRILGAHLPRFFEITGGIFGILGFHLQAAQLQ